MLSYFHTSTDGWLSCRVWWVDSVEQLAGVWRQVQQTELMWLWLIVRVSGMSLEWVGENDGLQWILGRGIGKCYTILVSFEGLVNIAGVSGKIAEIPVVLYECIYWRLLALQLCCCRCKEIMQVHERELLEKVGLDLCDVLQNLRLPCTG